MLSTCIMHISSQRSYDMSLSFDRWCFTLTDTTQFDRRTNGRTKEEQILNWPRIYKIYGVLKLAFAYYIL